MAGILGAQIAVLATLLLTTNGHGRHIATFGGNEIEATEIDPNTIIDLSMYGQRIFGYPDNETTGRLVAAFNLDSAGQNPEELGTYLEGDLLIPTNQFPERNGIITQSSHWPGAIVPYVIEGKFTARELAIIQYAINEYHLKTCLRFQPRTTERDYVSIVNAKTGCWSSVGRLGGRQEVNLQAPSCLRYYGTPIHELMHSIGFFHEQNRYDRDGYIRVLSENVQAGKMINFNKISSKLAYGFGVPYDYSSILHYSSRSFSTNGKPTILALRNTQEANMMGQRNGLSAGDVQKINKMYYCK